MNQDLSILHLVLEASVVVQLVMAILLGVSLASWSVIFGKVIGLKRIRQDNDSFDQAFWAGRTLQELFQDASREGGPRPPQGRVSAAGWRKFRRRRGPRVPDVPSLRDGARRAMRASYQREMD